MILNAMYIFKRSEENSKVYLLRNHYGEYVIPLNNMDVHNEMKQYLIMNKPYSAKMRELFAYTFELRPNSVFTSVEKLNENLETFGDINHTHLAYFKFSPDMKYFALYSFFGCATSKNNKIENAKKIANRNFSYLISKNISFEDKEKMDGNLDLLKINIVEKNTEDKKETVHPDLKVFDDMLKNIESNDIEKIKENNRQLRDAIKKINDLIWSDGPDGEILSKIMDMNLVKLYKAS